MLLFRRLFSRSNHLFWFFLPRWHEYCSSWKQFRAVILLLSVIENGYNSLYCNTRGYSDMCYTYPCDSVLFLTFVKNMSLRSQIYSFFGFDNSIITSISFICKDSMRPRISHQNDPASTNKINLTCNFSFQSEERMRLWELALPCC